MFNGAKGLLLATSDVIPDQLKSLIFEICLFDKSNNAPGIKELTIVAFMSLPTISKKLVFTKKVELKEAWSVTPNPAQSLDITLKLTTGAGGGGAEQHKPFK
jgi:hypothetical protein